MPPPLTTNLVLSLEADAITGKVDNDLITTWEDSHSSNNDAVGGSPLYKTNILNGLPVVRFDGADDVLTIAGITANTAARTIFVVANQAVATNFRRVWAFSHSQAGVTPITGVWNFAVNEGGAGQVLGGDVTAFTIVTLRFTSVTVADGYIDRGSAVNFDPMGVYAVDGGALVVGAESASTQFWNGDVAELAVYDAALSDGDRGQVEDYLYTKWFVPIAEPSTAGTLQSNLRLSNSRLA